MNKLAVILFTPAEKIEQESQAISKATKVQEIPQESVLQKVIVQTMHDMKQTGKALYDPSL